MIINGNAITPPGTASFTVWAPNATFPKLPMGMPQIILDHNDQPMLEFTGSKNGDGATFKPTVNCPNVMGKLVGGKYYVNQMITPQATGLDSNSTPIHNASTGLGEGLDNFPIYHKNATDPASWNANDPNPASTGDNPLIALSGTTTLPKRTTDADKTTLSEVTCDQSFVDTIMYRYDSQSSYVPLVASTWSWSATATLANGKWSVTNPNPVVPLDTQTAGEPTKHFPSWKRKYDNNNTVKWVKN